MSKKTVLDSCCIADLCRSLSAPTSCIELLELSIMQETAQECSKSLERFMWERGWLRASGSAWILFIPASWESWLDRLTSTGLLDTQPAHTHTHARACTDSTIDLTPWVLYVKACLLIQPYRGFIKAQTSIWYTSIQEKQRKCSACYGFSLICAFFRVKIVKIIFKPFYFCI